MGLPKIVEVLGQILHKHRSSCPVPVRQRVLEPDCGNLRSRSVDLVPCGELCASLGRVTGTWLGGPSLVVLGVVVVSRQHEITHTVRSPGLECELGVTVHQLPNQHFRPVTRPHSAACPWRAPLRIAREPGLLGCRASRVSRHPGRLAHSQPQSEADAQGVGGSVGEALDDPGRRQMEALRPLFPVGLRLQSRRLLLVPDDFRPAIPVEVSHHSLDTWTTQRPLPPGPVGGHKSDIRKSAP